jgi:hypothetical protein
MTRQDNNQSGEQTTDESQRNEQQRPDKPSPRVDQQSAGKPGTQQEESESEIDESGQVGIGSSHRNP